jgi:anti-sigma B factor antagonist
MRNAEFMTVSKLLVDEQQLGDVTLLVLSGQMLLDDGDLEFRRRIHDLVDRGRLKIIVDLADVTYIDSSGVGMMAAKLKTVRERGGDIRLLRLNARGNRLLSVAKLHTAFEIHNDQEMALRSFAVRPGS